MSVFTQRHYQKVAEIIGGLPWDLEPEDQLIVIDAFVEAFKDDNDRFKEDLFRKECVKQINKTYGTIR